MREAQHDWFPTQNVRIEDLRREISRLEGGRRPQTTQSISSGCRAGCADPRGGIPRRHPCRMAGQWRRDRGGNTGLCGGPPACAGGGLVVVDRQREFYPRPPSGWASNGTVDHRSSSEQGRSRLGLGPVAPLGGGGGNGGVARRPGGHAGWADLPPAATGGRRKAAAWGCLSAPPPPGRCPPGPTCDCSVEPLPGRRRWQGLLRGCRGISGHRQVELEIDDETRPVHVCHSLAARERPSGIPGLVVYAVQSFGGHRALASQGQPAVGHQPGGSSVRRRGGTRPDPVGRKAEGKGRIRRRAEGGKGEGMTVVVADTIGAAGAVAHFWKGRINPSTP